jgi:hypothetical protein
MESILSLHEDHDPGKIRIKFPSRSPIKAEVEGMQKGGRKEKKNRDKGRRRGETGE